jgi:hypothetical protein
MGGMLPALPPTGMVRLAAAVMSGMLLPAILNGTRGPSWALGAMTGSVAVSLVRCAACKAPSAVTVT